MDVTGSINNEEEGIESIENENEEDVDYSEERELVNDSCSTKVLNTCEEPRDRYWVVYLLFYLFGITSLVPWNFLITANDVSVFINSPVNN